MAENVEEEKKLGLKAKAMRELRFMKKGAKLLPRAIGKKAKGWAKKEWAAYKIRLREEREMEAAAKAVEKEAYKAERLRQAKLRGLEKARKGKGRPKGWREAFREVGEIGERMSLGGILGVETKPAKPRKAKPFEVGESPLMEGLEDLGVQPKKKKKKEKPWYDIY